MINNIFIKFILAMTFCIFSVSAFSQTTGTSGNMSGSGTMGTGTNNSLGTPTNTNTNTSTTGGFNGNSSGTTSTTTPQINGSPCTAGTANCICPPGSTFNCTINLPTNTNETGTTGTTGTTTGISY